MPKSTAILAPNLGLYLGQSSLVTDPRALIDGSNFRIQQGKLSNRNLGWTAFSAESWLPLNGPVILIDNFFPRGATEHLIFGTPTDLYRYVTGTPDNVVFLTPRYEVGTAAASGTAVTGTSTLWTTAGIKVNDEIAFGSAGETDPAATWFVVQSVDSETGITLTASATASDGPYTIRRLFTGQVSDGWSMDPFIDDAVSGDDLWLATNSKDDVVSWNGTANQVTLNPQLGFKCSIITVFSNMVIYGDLVVSGVDKPTSIINSDVGKPLLAGSVGTGLSGQFKVHDGTDRLENMIPLGDNLIVYSAGHITPVQFVGDPLVFVFQQAFESIGPVGPNAIAAFGDFHTFIGADAQYEFDGVTLKTINTHLWREVIRQTDPVRRPLIFAHFDEENGDLIWSVPLTTDTDLEDANGQSEFAYAEHYLEETPPEFESSFSKRFFPFTSSGFYEKAEGVTWASLTQTWAETNFAWNDQFFTQAFPQNLAGDKSGNVWQLNESQKAAGADLLSFVKFGRTALGSGRERGLLTRIYAFMEESSGNLDVKIYMSDHAAGPAPLTESFVMDLGLAAEGHFVSPFRAGRFVEIRFGTTGGLWTLQGYDTDSRQGSFR